MGKPKLLVRYNFVTGIYLSSIVKNYVDSIQSKPLNISYFCNRNTEYSSLCLLDISRFSSKVNGHESAFNSNDDNCLIFPI